MLQLEIWTSAREVIPIAAALTNYLHKTYIIYGHCYIKHTLYMVIALPKDTNTNRRKSKETVQLIIIKPNLGQRKSIKVPINGHISVIVFILDLS